ncbi:hypothetical protein RoPhREQ3_gp05 [Rhodococcus phage REQ3]|uniref:Uncharacterized protein n=1 Tax=Rhodococcus phage REQ3 TaxID=1109714 RepID=G9FH52_9CAUD|nr:hypothetical protein RoPhREQ3_gp05 [Rhodococcus phage REQ3]AEV51941.1 hypothetical protein [Rhodococcus phage REQ3]
MLRQRSGYAARSAESHACKPVCGMSYVEVSAISGPTCALPSRA